MFRFIQTQMVIMAVLMSVYFSIIFYAHTQSSFTLNLSQSEIIMNIGYVVPETENHSALTVEDSMRINGQVTKDKCRRKDHVAYIKTHKTGSTTIANIFWRYVFFIIAVCRTAM